MEENELKIYNIVKLQNEKYTVSIANRIATDKVFDTKEEAEEYAKKPKWDLICTLILVSLENADELIEDIKDK